MGTGINMVQIRIFKARFDHVVEHVVNDWLQREFKENKIRIIDIKMSTTEVNLRYMVTVLVQYIVL